MATIQRWRLFLWKAHREQQLDKVGMNEMVTITRHCQWYAQPLSSAVSCENNLYNIDNTSVSMVIFIRKSSHTHALPHIIAMANIRGWHLFRSELPIVWLIFEGGDYSRAVSIQ